MINWPETEHSAIWPRAKNAYFDVPDGFRPLRALPLSRRRLPVGKDLVEGASFF